MKRGDFSLIPASARLRRLKYFSGVATDAANCGKFVVRYLIRRPPDHTFALFAELEGETGPFVDVGANYGQSAVSFRLYNRSMPIVSFEINPHLQRWLAIVAKVVPAMDVRMLGLASESRRAVIHLPRFGRTTNAGGVSLDRQFLLNRASELEAQYGQPMEIRSEPVELHSFDSLGLRARVVKLDVEGSEYDVLQGMRSTLTTERPAIRIEVRLSDGRAQGLLNDHGYDCFVYDIASRQLREWDSAQDVVDVVALHRDDSLRRMVV